jgi:Arc/MetJ family transcription regulator
MMPNLEIDRGLIQQALTLAGHGTEKAVIEEALREYVQRRNQLKILDLFGTVNYDSDYDYKEQRQQA